MSEKNEVKQKILYKSDELFRQFGFSKITMEEIAASLAISKKTLYKHFSNKEHILRELVSSIKCEVDSFIENLINDRTIDFIEKLKRFMTFIAKQAGRMDGQLIHDLMKHHPDIWADIQEFRNKKAYINLSALIQQGIKSGIFRDDINTEVIVIIYVSAIHGLINPETLSKLPVSADQAFREIIKILFEGIFTSDGRKKYKTSILIKENYGELRK